MKKIFTSTILFLCLGMGISHAQFIPILPTRTSQQWFEPLQALGGLTFAKKYSIGQNSLNADYYSGSGAATFTASRDATHPATYIDSSGVIQATTTSDVPRWTSGFYDDTGYNTAPGLLIEGARTNLLVHGIFDTDAGVGLATGWNDSDDVTNVATYTLVEESIMNISSSHAQRWQRILGDGTYDQIYSTVTAVGSIAQNDKVTFSVWLKGAVPGISLLRLVIKQYDAAGALGTTTNSSDIKADVSATEWKRFEHTITAADADVSKVDAWVSIIHPGSGSIDLYIAGAQVEQAPYATSLIPTTSAALTRNAEVLKYVNDGNRTAATESIYVKFTPMGDFTNDGISRVIIDSDTKRRLVYKLSTGTTLVTYPNLSDSAGTIKSNTTSLLENTSYVYTATMASTGNPNLRVYLDGSQEGTDNNDDFTANAWGTYFYVGSNNSGISHFNGILEAVAFFKEVHNASVVSQVTIILNR